LLPLLDAVQDNTGEMPGEASAGNGFCAEANLEGLIERAVRGYVATGRARKPSGGTKGGSLMQAMRTRLKRGGHQSRYRLRKFTVEPVFGHIKQARGFRQFLLRGIDKVKSEWAMICPAHNLAKLTA
jgi:Transposase DDE domain